MCLWRCSNAEYTIGTIAERLRWLPRAIWPQLVGSLAGDELVRPLLHELPCPTQHPFHSLPHQPPSCCTSGPGTTYRRSFPLPLVVHRTQSFLSPTRIMHTQTPSVITKKSTLHFCSLMPSLVLHLHTWSPTFTSGRPQTHESGQFHFALISLL